MIQFEKRWREELEFWFSLSGEEMQRNLVAQGHEKEVFFIMARLFGTYWTAAEIVKELRNEVVAQDTKHEHI